MVSKIVTGGDNPSLICVASYGSTMQFGNDFSRLIPDGSSNGISSVMSDKNTSICGANDDSCLWLGYIRQ